MPFITPSMRLTKHRVFGILPGRIGLWNRACLHHLTKPNPEGEFEKALDSLREGDVCIDCGANVGQYSKRFADRGATVYSFEPDPWSFEQLTNNVGAMRNVVTINKAVGTSNGTAQFFRSDRFLSDPRAHSLGSSTLERVGTNQISIEVEVVDFLEFVRSLNTPLAILKMDIEGAEVSILEGLFTSSLVNRFSHIFVETHELQFPALLERTWRLRELAKTLEGVNVSLDWH